MKICWTASAFCCNLWSIRSNNNDVATLLGRRAAGWCACPSSLNNEVSDLYFNTPLRFKPHSFTSQRQAVRGERRAHKDRPSLINGQRDERGHNGSSAALHEYTTENNGHTAILGHIIAYVLWQRVVCHFITPPYTISRPIQAMCLQIFPPVPHYAICHQFWVGIISRNPLVEIYDKTVIQGSAYADEECDWLISLLDCQDGGYRESNDP